MFVETEAKLKLKRGQRPLKTLNHFKLAAFTQHRLILKNLMSNINKFKFN